jgi:sugar phosphate permease
MYIYTSMKIPNARNAECYRWAIYAVLAAAYFLVYFHRLSLSVVADTLVVEFATSAGVIGLLGSVYFYCYAVMQLPAGLLADSVGPRKTVAFSLMIAAFGSVLFGFSPDIETAFVGRMLVGFGAAMVFIPTMKILSQWFRPREFAFMAGILNAVGGVGVMAATWLLAVMTMRLGWRVSFEIIGGITLVVVLANWLIVRDRPESAGLPPLIPETGAAAAADPKISLAQGVRQVLSNRYFWPVALWFFFDCGIFFGFGALWSGPYLMHVYGFSREETGALLSMIAWGMIIGSPLLGTASDKWLKSRKKPFILCTAGLLAILLALYLNPGGFSKPALYLIFFIFSLCSSAIVVIGFTMTKELFPIAIAGTSVGMVNLFPFLGGAIYMPLLGRILDAYRQTDTGVNYLVEGYSALLLFLMISAGAALLCASMMQETLPSRK